MEWMLILKPTIKTFIIKIIKVQIDGMNFDLKPTSNTFIVQNWIWWRRYTSTNPIFTPSKGYHIVYISFWLLLTCRYCCSLCWCRKCCCRRRWRCICNGNGRAPSSQFPGWLPSPSWPSSSSHAKCILNATRAEKRIVSVRNVAKRFGSVRFAYPKNSLTIRRRWK